MSDEIRRATGWGDLLNAFNRVANILLGNHGGRIRLVGDDGVKRNIQGGATVSTGNYALYIDSGAGNHIQVPAIFEVQDAQIRGLIRIELRNGSELRFYNAGNTNFAQLVHSGTDDVLETADALRVADALGIGVTAADIAALAAGDVLAAANLHFRSGTTFEMTFDHAITADRTLIFQDVPAGIACVLNAANSGGHLLFVDNTVDIGASGATRPRNLYLAGLAVFGGGLTLSGHLLFTADATYDIGASGATRPRHIYLSGNIVAGGAITVTGGQIAFPATQSASADANTLDDYEEGTWTPAVGGTATYTTQSAAYIKIGRVVHIWGQLHINTLGTGSTSTITGLPFAADFADTPIPVGHWEGLAVTPVSVSLRINSSSLIALGATAAAATVTSPLAIFGNGARIFFAGSYRTAN